METSIAYNNKLLFLIYSAVHEFLKQPGAVHPFFAAFVHHPVFQDPPITSKNQLHYGKSFRPFELFVNENYKL